MNFQNQVIWITGASSGIGEALAKAFAAQGAKLILSARREDELMRVKEQCAATSVFVLPLDLAQTDSLADKTKQAIDHFGRIDVLINNGGISQRALAQNTLLAVDRRIMEVNFFGTVALTKAVLPHFVANQKGQVVVITSLVGKFGTPLRSVYSASKHALHGFFDSLRAEMWRDNLRVLIVCPGFIKTPITFAALTGTGEPQNVMDDAQANGMSADLCAQKILKAIRANKQEVYIGGLREVMGVYLKRFFPRLFANVIKKAKVT